MDEGRAPIPFRQQIALGNAACGGGEKTVGNSRGDEIAVRFVQNKCDVISSRQFGEGGDETRGIYGTRLGMGSTEMAISWHARKTYRVVRGDQDNRLGLRSNQSGTAFGGRQEAFLRRSVEEDRLCAEHRQSHSKA